MKKLIVFALLLQGLHCPCRAFDKKDKFLSVVKLPPQTVTKDKISSLLGQPQRIEENKKGCVWYYQQDSSVLSVHWRNNSINAEKYSFNHIGTKKSPFDYKIQQNLKEGVLDMYQAVLLLGTPKDMTIKEGTQVMRYSFQGNMLRLFFRDRKLVDYALVESANH